MWIWPGGALSHGIDKYNDLEMGRKYIANCERHSSLQMTLAWLCGHMMMMMGNVRKSKHRSQHLNRGGCECEGVYSNLRSPRRI